MKKTNKIKGGVRLSGSYRGSKTEALVDFLQNSTFSFISNSTISCFSCLAVLNRGVTSYFKSCRSNNLDSEVRTLFVKFMLCDNSKDEVTWHEIRSRNYGGIEISCPKTINRECEIQRMLYKNSLLAPDSFMDAICPCIVGAGTFSMQALAGLTPVQQRQFNEITNAVGGNIKLNYIAMEMMDGFIPAKDFFPKLPNGKYDISTKRNQFLQQLIEYEFERLNLTGFCHGDAHFGNVMINPYYPYLSNEPAKLGKAIIIDFGRTRPLTEDEKTKKRNGLVQNRINYIYPIERFHLESTVLVRLTKESAANFRKSRVSFTDSIKSILFDFIKTFYRKMYNKDLPEVHTVDGIISFIKLIVLDTTIIRERRPTNLQLFFEGGTDLLTFKTNPQSVRRVYSKNDFGDMDMEKMDMDMEKMDMEKMDMEKMDMEKIDMEKIDMEKNVEYDEEPEIFELHNTDWSEFLKPIKKQLKTMNFKEFINILQEEYNNNFPENVTINKKSIVNSKRKLKLKKTQKTNQKTNQKMQKTNQKMQKTKFSINPRIISTPIYTI